MKVSKQLERILIPSGLTEKREKKLKEIREDLMLCFASKSHAMWNLKNYSLSKNDEDLQEFSLDSSLAQNNITEAVTKLTMLKKEMGMI